MDYRIRPIQEKDDAAVEQIIRDCLREFGADHAGCAWTDPDLGRFSHIYQGEDRRYWVAVDLRDRPVGGVGIGPMPPVDGLCELQKMYCRPAVRGQGIARALMDVALAFAGERYTRCYLETFANMTAARRLYEAYGFTRVDKPLVDTGHFACDVYYVKKL